MPTSLFLFLGVLQASLDELFFSCTADMRWETNARRRIPRFCSLREQKRLGLFLPQKERKRDLSPEEGRYLDLV